MAVKYTFPFKAHDNVQWRVDIATTAYLGDAIPVRGVSDQCAVLAYAVDSTDEPFSPTAPSTLTISCYNEGQIDINELQNAQDRDFTVSIYRTNVLKWVGFLNTDGIQRPLLSNPTSITLSAVCGLALLQNIPYVHNDLPGGRCPINYIRNILFTNLGITLPIRWTNLLQCTAFLGQDVMAGSVMWAVDGQGFQSFQSATDGDKAGPVYDCLYILTALLQAFQCRIYQDRGFWIIRRVNDVIRGNITYNQIRGDLGELVVSSSSENLTNQIGRSGYNFINEDQLITVVPGLLSCQVTYTANVRQNILPNGSIDYLDANSDILYWKMIDTVGALSSHPVAPLDSRIGFAASLENNNFLEDLYFSMNTGQSDLKSDGLPIDAQTLIAYINFGFQFVLTLNFPTTGGGLIDWSSEPFKIQVVYNTNTIRYYLNAQGFWVTTETFISIVVDGLSLNDVAQIDFNAFQKIPLPLPDRQPQAGDTCDIQILFVCMDSQEYELDNIYINIAGGNDVYKSTYTASRNTNADTRELNISSSFNGYMLSNFMTSPFNSDVECYFKDGDAYTGSLTGLTANAIMRYRYKNSNVFNGSIYVANGNWSFDQIYLIDSFNASKFLPLNANYNIEKCQVTGLVAMECRNDIVELAETFFSSNDNQNSN